MSIKPGRQRYASRTSFELPMAADNYFFLARGDNNQGAMHVSYREDDNEIILVNVTAYYDDHYELDRANVCLLQRDSEHGVGIFVSLLSELIFLLNPDIYRLRLLST